MRTRRPLTAIECANKIAIELADLPERIIAARKKAVLAAEDKERDSSKAAVYGYMALCPEGERAKVARLLLANETNLYGMTIEAGNDTDASDLAILTENKAAIVEELGPKSLSTRDVESGDVPLPRGAQPFTPGPAARAATERR